MTETVVVLGAGYAGTGAVKRLQSALPDLETATDLVWISEHDYHLVLHESHRVVRDPSVAGRITIPIDRIADGNTEFVEGLVEDVDVDRRVVELAGGRTVAYDYLLVAVGSRTAFYGIPGLEDNAHTLESLDDAMAIHEDLAAAGDAATPADPATVVVGGAGLSGIQTAGEVARYRDERDAPVRIHLVEALEEVFPGNDESIQAALRRLLEAADVRVTTDDPITEATASTVRLEEVGPLDYDVFVWTGGITGGQPLGRVGVEKHRRSNRLLTGATFRTSDDRVFAVGDAALIEYDGSPAPPTAQAAWGAAGVAGENLARAVEGRPLTSWTYEDRGTLVSVGESAVAHDVAGIPVETFDSYPAKFLEKFVAARWIADVTSWRRAIRAWGVL